MGDAIRKLRIPIDAVLSSPTYRALETVRFARLSPVTEVTELGDGGQSMQAVAEAQAMWLRAKVAEVSQSGNTLIVTHQPNLGRAFPEWGSTVMDGEIVVVQPDRKGGLAVVGRIPIEGWPRLK